VTVNYATADGSAAAGIDYQAATGTITFSPGQTSKNVAVLVNGDRLGEPNETFSVNLNNPSGGVIADGQGIATIIDDEPRISVGDASATEGNSDTTDMVFSVTLSQPSDIPVTVDFATTDGSATAGTDYQTISGTLTFAPGEVNKTVTVTINGDRLAEPTEDLTLNLSNATNAAINTGQASGDIVDNEPLADISFAPSQPEGDAGTTVFTFTISLSEPASDLVLVNYATADAGATAGSDYQAISGTLTFAPGETSKTISLVAYGDRVLEYDESFVVYLSSGAASAGMIQNDDGPVMNITDNSVYEGDSGSTFIGFTVWLSMPATETVTVDFSTFDGTAIAGSDYLATNGTLTFAPGETSQTIWVEVLGDTDYEGDEYFYVNFSNNSSNSLIQQAWGTGSILDNDYVDTSWWW
jgi:hypothetical protein